MVEAMGRAFAITCAALGLNDRADPITNLVAEKIIELAQRGFSTPNALYMAAIEEFKSDPQ